ncbi:MAG: hypothetical protein RR505_07960 [Raoultibacter sp.]
MAYDLNAAVKRKLNITWSDGETDMRIADVIATVAPAVARVVALDVDSAKLTDDAETRGLVVNACFYEWSHALDDFWGNYADDIQRCRIKHEMEAARVVPS